MTSEKKLVVAAWGLSAFVSLLAIFVWLQGMDWRFAEGPIIYQLFPLFGLLAFSIMWSHYIAAAMRARLGAEKKVLHRYFETTSFLTLIAFLLHPCLLWFQLWKDGLGLPPQSHIQNYVAPSLRWAAALGSLSLLAFLAYEFRRVFQKKSWWRFVTYASDIAMVAIFVHGLKLGRNLYTGWFPYVWYAYGVGLVISIVYLRWGQYRETGSKAWHYVHARKRTT
jgi:hypothetical protein